MRQPTVFQSIIHTIDTTSCYLDDRAARNLKAAYSLPHSEVFEATRDSYYNNARKSAIHSVVIQMGGVLLNGLYLKKIIDDDLVIDVIRKPFRERPQKPLHPYSMAGRFILEDAVHNTYTTLQKVYENKHADKEFLTQGQSNIALAIDLAKADALTSYLYEKNRNLHHMKTFNHYELFSGLVNYHTLKQDQSHSRRAEDNEINAVKADTLKAFFKANNFATSPLMDHKDAMHREIAELYQPPKTGFQFRRESILRN